MENLDLGKNIPPKEEPVLSVWTRRMLRNGAFWLAIIIVIIYTIVNR